MEDKTIMLSDEQRKELLDYTKKGTHSVHLVNRARVILLLDRKDKKDHLRMTRIQDQVGLSRQAIYDIRNDFLNAPSITEFLKRKKRETPPVPAKITGEVEAHIIALSCTDPPDGHARWTVKLLAERSVELNIIDSISPMSVCRLLKKHLISLF